MQFFDEDYFQEWKRRFPGAETALFPEAGHYLMEDAGGEVCSAIGRFLAAHPLEAKVA